MASHGILANLAARGWAPAAIILTAAIAALDILTGFELSFSIFYLIPIALVAWYGNRNLALLACTLSALIWLIADLVAGQHYSQSVVFVWNAAVRLGFFVIVAMLLSALRGELQVARELSRSDYLTGAASPSFFYSLLRLEIARCNRHGRPFTLAYLDLDNFKVINDRLGHSTGDEVLRRMVTCIKSRLRRTDIVARLGGDEFSLLLPETAAEAARTVVCDLQRLVQSELKTGQWDVTFSIGAVTFLTSPLSANEAIGLVDRLMYSVKNNGKNSVRFAVYPPDSPPNQSGGVVSPPN